MTKISLCLNRQSCHGRKILIVFATWSLQNGHLETADEHLRQSTWPHGTIVMSTSLVKHTRQSHAAFAVSASFAATSAFSCIQNLSTWNFHYISCHVKLSVEFSEETFLLWNLNSKPELISIDTMTLNSHNEFWNCKSQTCSSKSAAWDSFNCSCRVNVLSKRDCFSTSTLIPASESISWTAWTSSAGDTRWSSLPPCSWH